MEIIILAIVVGIIIGWLDIFSYRIKLWLNRLSTVCLFLMLICLGAKIGCDANLLGQIERLGRQSLLLGGSAILGSLLLVYVVIKLLAPDFAKEERP